MLALVRITLIVVVALVALALAAIVLKLVLALAVIAALIGGAIFLYHFTRSLLRRLATPAEPRMLT